MQEKKYKHNSSRRTRAFQRPASWRYVDAMRQHRQQQHVQQEPTANQTTVAAAVTGKHYRPTTSFGFAFALLHDSCRTLGIRSAVTLSPALSGCSTRPSALFSEQGNEYDHAPIKPQHALGPPYTYRSTVILFRGGRRVIVVESSLHITAKIDSTAHRHATFGSLVDQGQHVNFLLSAVSQRRVPELPAVRRIAIIL